MLEKKVKIVPLQLILFDHILKEVCFLSTKLHILVKQEFKEGS